MFHNFPKCLIMAINHSILSGRFIIRSKLKWTNGVKLVNEINYWNWQHAPNESAGLALQKSESEAAGAIGFCNGIFTLENEWRKRISIFKAMLFTLFFSSIVARAILFVYVRNEFNDTEMPHL